MRTMDLVAHFDGAFSKTEKNAACGSVIRNSEGDEVEGLAENLNPRRWSVPNNQIPTMAEIYGLLELMDLLDQKYSDIEVPIFGDNALVCEMFQLIKQLADLETSNSSQVDIIACEAKIERRTKKFTPDLKWYTNQLRKQIRRVRCSLNKVPSEENRVADAIANYAYDIRGKEELSKEKMQEIEEVRYYLAKDKLENYSWLKKNVPIGPSPGPPVRIQEQHWNQAAMEAVEEAQRKVLFRRTDYSGNPNSGRSIGGGGGEGGNLKTKKIFVGGLPPSLTEHGFRRYFETYGNVTDVVVMYDQSTQRPRGFGFVSFDTEDAVDRVLHKTFHDLNGKTVEVKRALPKDANRSSGGHTIGGGGGYQSYGGSSGNGGSYDGWTVSRYGQPQSAAGQAPGAPKAGYLQHQWEPKPYVDPSP